MTALQKPIYRFGEFELDSEERRLRAHGASIALTPKVFDTLVLLVEQAGHVVGKDELMQALWPRGFVDESNLTKHVWLIRKTLGGEQDGEFIETVPKRGYRFVWPVQRVERVDCEALVGANEASAIAPQDSLVAPPETTSDDAVATAMRSVVATARDSEPPAQSVVPAPITAVVTVPRGLRTGIAGIASTIVVVAALAVWRLAPHDVPAATADSSGHALAIVAFNNLSQNAKDAWLAPALGEMLATEIAASSRIHALPDELVRPARDDLAAPLAGGYAAQSLAVLRKRLGADYVLSGSYLVSGSGDEAHLRLDLALQDARDGRAVASLAREGRVGELPTLVNQSGAALRAKLGESPASGSELQQVAAAQPPSAEVARRLGFALGALQRNDPARARDELLDAVAQAPSYAPSYSYLAQAWSALGYKAKALAAAQQAAAHADGLPQEQRLQIDAQVQAAQRDWGNAIDTRRALVRLRPQNPEYRFGLIAALIAGGKPDLAQDELDAWAKRPGALADDPRMELEQARVAAAHDDYKQQAQRAELALGLAREHEEGGLAAEAGALLGIARDNLGDSAGAEQALKQARADYVRVGNPHGEAWVDQNFGNAWMEHDPKRAREAYQRALAGYQSIGDLDGEAAVYSDIGIMLWTAGDRDGTETAVRKSLAIRRETADLAGQAWNLAALGAVELDMGATAEAADEFREAVALDEQAGERKHRAFVLMQYSDLQRLRGDLDQAKATCAQALQSYREQDYTADVAAAEFQCALIALDYGELDAAKAGAARAMAGTPPLEVAFNVHLLIAQMMLGGGDFTAALAPLRAALEVSRKAELVTGEAIAQGQLALAYAGLGREDERDRAAQRAKELRNRITEQQEVFALDIALAQLRGDAGQVEGAVATLRDLGGQADRRDWIAWSLECRLATWQLLEQRHDPAAGPLRRALSADATAHGFKWIVARLKNHYPAPRA